MKNALQIGARVNCSWISIPRLLAAEVIGPEPDSPPAGNPVAGEQGVHQNDLLIPEVRHVVGGCATATAQPCWRHGEGCGHGGVTVGRGLGGCRR